jgi:hypothetical protein
VYGHHPSDDTPDRISKNNWRWANRTDNDVANISAESLTTPLKSVMLSPDPTSDLCENLKDENATEVIDDADEVAQWRRQRLSQLDSLSVSHRVTRRDVLLDVAAQGERTERFDSFGQVDK